jgi:hypothetical protein
MPDVNIPLRRWDARTGDRVPRTRDDARDRLTEALTQEVRCPGAGRGGYGPGVRRGIGRPGTGTGTAHAAAIPGAPRESPSERLT